jgi:thioredoxin-like negative regulator of GroEL
MGIPTLLVFKDGKVVARQSGVMGLDALEGWLRQAGVA